jgi:hypothetical protein
MNETALVQKVWNYAHVLRDQGVPYQAYISQISYLLFLKMDDERARLVASGLIRGEGSSLPEDCRWPVLRDLQGEELTRRYSAILDELSRLSGIVGTIFLKAQNEIQDSAKLRRLVGLIDGETWLGLGVDVKGSIYEGSARTQCAGGQVGCGAIFHSAHANRRDGDRDRSRAAGNHRRPRLRHRRLSARGLRAHAQKAAGAQCRSIYRYAITVLGHRHRARSRAAVRDEPLSA